MACFLPLRFGVCSKGLTVQMDVVAMTLPWSHLPNSREKLGKFFSSYVWILYES